MNVMPLPKRRHCIAIAVGTILGGLHLQAFAQEQEKRDKELETIVVSAQKRVQNLQEVPISVSAMNSEELSTAVVKDVQDLQVHVPGLNVTQGQSANNVRFSIRGIGTNGQNYGLESSVGLYVDGVYRARANALVNNMVDLQAVEVLRGPQGTLFGKNTPTGAILMNSVAPSHHGDGFIEATVGNYGLFNLSGATSISAIEDVLAFRVTGFSSDRDGVVSDVSLGEDVINDRNRWGGRVQALYTPSDDFSLRVIADYAEIDEACCAVISMQSNFMARDIANKFGTDALLAAAPFNAPFGDGDSFFDLETTFSNLPETYMEDRGLSLEMNWSLSDSVKLVWLSAYRSFDTRDVVDADFGAADLLQTYNEAEQSSFSQELRLDYSSDDLNLILGAYYFTQELDLDYSLTIGSDFENFFLFGAQQLNPLLDAINGLSTATGGLIAPVAPATPEGSSFDHTALQDQDSYALFGQLDYRINDRWTVTAGLRYTNEEKDLVNLFSEQIPGGQGMGPVPNPQAAGVSAATTAAVLQMGGMPNAEQMAGMAPFQTPGWGYYFVGTPAVLPREDVDVNLDDDRVTGTLKLSYQPDSKTLFYASYGTGYKSGGTNTDRIDIQFDPVFDAEKSAAFEIGVKKDFPEQALRINAALHKTDITDFQANTFNGTGFNLQNAGDIESSGLEMEVTWLATDTTTVNLAYAYTDVTFKSFEKGTCWLAYTWHTGIDDPGRQNPEDRFCDRAGGRLGAQPEHQLVLQLNQTYELSADIYADFTAEYAYTSDMFMNNNNDPFAYQDAYSLLNLRLNLIFDDYDTNVVLWGRNVLDEEYYNGVAIDAPVQEGKIMSHPGEQATFGVTVTKRF